MNETKSILCTTNSEQENKTGEQKKAEDAVHGIIDISADAGREKDYLFEEENKEKEEQDEEKEASESELEELIKGRYARAFGTKVQKIIDRRFKQTKIIENRLKEQEELISKLCVLVGEDDWQRLYGKVESRLASKPEKSEGELAEMVGKAKLLYPDFDEKRELSVEAFKKYVDIGLDYSEAYTLAHLDQIKRKLVREGASQAVRSISSTGIRPVEGEGGHGPMRSSKKTISSLEPKEIRNLIERARKGEKIRFSDI